MSNLSVLQSGVVLNVYKSERLKSVIYHFSAGEVAYVAPTPGIIYNPGEKPYPHELSLQDRLGEIRENPTQSY